jgi:hypothetical protein
MLWSEVKRWAKDQGFEVVKEKDDSINGASYYWAKSSDHSVSGIAPSVSKLATAIFNTITENKWTEYQKEYKEKQEYKHFTVTDYN